MSRELIPIFVSADPRRCLRSSGARRTLHPLEGWTQGRVRSYSAFLVAKKAALLTPPLIYPRCSNVENCTPDGRLPDGDKGAYHIRKIFYRMGFNDNEIVALSGAHALGRCHIDRSGFDGPWQVRSTRFLSFFVYGPSELTRLCLLACSTRRRPSRE